MHFEKVRIGMKVKITSTEHTHRIYDSNNDMRDMVGATYTIAKILENNKLGHQSKHPFKIKFVEQTRYVWDPGDLEYAGPPIIKPKGGTFDTQNLVV